MKNIFRLLMIATIFSLVACAEPTEGENAAAEADAAEMMGDIMGGLEGAVMKAVVEEDAAEEHVCDDKCVKEGCSHAKEEHTCGESCSAGTHKCGSHCGCGDDCKCTAEASCSDKCEFKTTGETTEE